MIRWLNRLAPWNLASQTARRLAQVVTGLGLALMLLVLVVGYQVNIYGYQGEITNWYDPIVQAGPLVAALLVGGLIATRLPNNPYGWVWLLVGFAGGVIQPVGALMAVRALSSEPPSLFWGGVFAYLAAVGWWLAFPVFPFLFLLYPTGRLPSPRWRWLAWLVAAIVALGLLLSWAVAGESSTAPVVNPFGQENVFGEIVDVVGLAAIVIDFFLLLPLAAFSLVLRYRRAGGIEKAQLRWLAFSAMLVVLIEVVDGSDIHLALIPEDTMTTISNLALITLPVSVGVAILRYRLYDIDLIIRRTIQYALLTGLLAAIYFGTVVLLQSIFSAVGGTQSSAAVVFSTLVIAFLFNPLRRRLQAGIDKRFFRRKYDSELALARFASAPRDEIDQDGLIAALLGVVHETVQPERASIWINKQGTRQPEQDQTLL